MVQLLLEADADPNALRQGCWTALQIATFNGSEFIVKHLIEANADINLHCDGYFDGVRHPQDWI